VDIYLMQSLI